jgi:hypothetical protein
MTTTCGTRRTAFCPWQGWRSLEGVLNAIGMRVGLTATTVALLCCYVFFHASLCGVFGLHMVTDGLAVAAVSPTWLLQHSVKNVIGTVCHSAPTLAAAGPKLFN